MSYSIFPPASAGIPSGDSAGRPVAPVIGDTYYNGELTQLEIYDGSEWVPVSAVPGSIKITPTDVGTNVPYGSAQASIAITEPTNGGNVTGYLISSTVGNYTATTTSTSGVITVGNHGTWSFYGQGYNDFGTGVVSPTTSATLTTVPQSPSNTTATTSNTTSDVVVSWTIRDNGGKPLTSITITPYLNGTTAQTSLTAATTSSTSIVVTTLTPLEDYTFKVKLTNANGDSIEGVSNEITALSFINVDFLVIAGGGSGGSLNSLNANNGHGGGGGAGGYRTSTTTSGGNSTAEPQLNLAINADFTVTVGAGGARPGNDAQGNDGSNSVLASIVSTGGGGGGSYSGGGNGKTGRSGGSGGGGGAHNTNQGSGGAGGSGTTGQGFSGGGGQGLNGPGTGGGGGGASAAGVDGNTSTDRGKGGNGLANDITGTSVTRGGGGGGGSSSAGGTGGGGGGNSKNGVAGTGGGGGGGIYQSGSNDPTSAGTGGSGIVVLRYPNTYSTSGGTGLTFNTNTSGNNKITTFNAGTGSIRLVP